MVRPGVIGAYTIGADGVWLYEAGRPGPGWHKPDWKPRRVVVFTDGGVVLPTVLRRRWRLHGTTTTRLDRSPDEVGRRHVVLLVLLLKVWAWLSSDEGVHVYEEQHPALEAHGSRRTCSAGCAPCFGPLPSHRRVRGAGPQARGAPEAPGAARRPQLAWPRRPDAIAARRAEADAAVFDVLAARLDPGVVDPPTIRAFLARFGPWDPVRVAELVDAFLTLHPRETHVQVLLDHQRDLFHGLMLWSEVRGMALVTGPSGAGKSITVRRFARSLDEGRFRVVYLSHARSTLTGFVRSNNRALELPMRQHGNDLFDQAHAHLTANGPDRGPHPVLVLDDAEAKTPDLFDVLRRLTNHALDAEDRFSVLITGTDAVLRTLRDPALEPFNTRLGFVHNLRGFTLEDTRNYVAFQLRYAGAREQFFAEGAIKKLFQASGGTPRRINQLALHVLIQGAVLGIDTITSEFMTQQVQNHPLYDTAGGA